MDKSHQPDIEQCRQRANMAAIKFGYEPRYEERQLTEFQLRLAEADRFIDVGANRGIYSYLANLAMENGSIYLIEADPRMAERLSAEVQAWDDNGNRIEVIAMGAGDRKATIPFRIGDADTVGSFTVSDYHTTAPQITNVEVGPLNEIVAAADNTYVKIDVEGYEYRVISGASLHLAKRNCELVIELHGWGDPELHKYPFDVLFKLYTSGYAVDRIGRSYEYRFSRGNVFQNTISFLTFAPLLLAKSLLRQMGVRSVLQHFGLIRTLEPIGS